MIAGEASGDFHGAWLIAELRSASPGIRIYGVGGGHIRDTGALEFLDIAHFHVTGLTDALRSVPDYRRASRRILDSVRRVRPDTVVLIDNPGFNLHLADRIHRMGIPIAYYIAPQLWAWAPGRVRRIKASVSKVLVVFEFEKAIYQKHGVDVAWVGHPLMDRLAEIGPRPRPGTGPRIALLPGSRRGEVATLLPVFLKAAALIRARFPHALFSVIKARSVPMAFYDDILRRNPTANIDMVAEGTYGEIRASRFALVCSGTATLECALLGTPMLIAYRASFITALAARCVVRVPYLGLPNLILGREAFPELLQYRATPPRLAQAALEVLGDERIMARMNRDLEEIAARVGPPGAARRAAEEILKLV